MQPFEQLGLLGCGLMGGSLALALKKAGLVKRVVGYSKSPSTTEQACRMGVIDVPAPSALLAVAGADLVVLAVPVAATAALLETIQRLVTPEMLVMDLGSTKADVMRAARATLGRSAASFVPAHPIAGREVSGVAHADAALYQGACVILTPGEETRPGHVRRACALWEQLGCRVHGMSAEAHDSALATVSHLPHLLAFAMMHSLLAQPHSDEVLSLAGPGFRDFTRIAASDAHMWRDILLANAAQVLHQSRQFRQSLQELEKLLETGNGQGLQDRITLASAARQHWRQSSKKHT